jgi:para-aminobenzoate synthetase component I
MPIAAPVTPPIPRRLAPLDAIAVSERPDLAGVDMAELAERLRGLPGLSMLETRRPSPAGRWSYLTADPIDVLEVRDPDLRWTTSGRALLARLARDDPGTTPGDGPPFFGGLIGFLGYELGGAWERPPQGRETVAGPLPLARLALHDWVLARDERTGRCWLGGRAVDGDVDRLHERLAAVDARLATPSGPAVDTPPPPGRFLTITDRPDWIRSVEEIRSAIGRGEIYQANLSRRLETEWRGAPWPLYRRLRVGDPVRFQAFLDLGGGRAIVSSSPEPFLRATPFGDVRADPIKGTRPRGATSDDDRALARELIGSPKDRAENVMIVDVLRNDLGRVCRPGTVRVPRLLRLERTATVQHLVSAVTGRLGPGRDAFDLLAAALPGGSITGAPKQRAIDLLAGLEPVARGPYTGAIGWLGPDGAMATSIAIRTWVADGETLALHVGGGITWRSDAAAEWDETVAKAAGPLRAIGAAVGAAAT